MDLDDPSSGVDLTFGADPNSQVRMHVPSHAAGTITRLLQRMSTEVDDQTPRRRMSDRGEDTSRSMPKLPYNRFSREGAKFLAEWIRGEFTDIRNDLIVALMNSGAVQQNLTDADVQIHVDMHPWGYLNSTALKVTGITMTMLVGSLPAQVGASMVQFYYPIRNAGGWADGPVRPIRDAVIGGHAIWPRT